MEPGDFGIENPMCGQNSSMCNFSFDFSVNRFFDCSTNPTLTVWGKNTLQEMPARWYTSCGIISQTSESTPGRTNCVVDVSFQHRSTTTANHARANSSTEFACSAGDWSRSHLGEALLHRDFRCQFSYYRKG